MILIGLGTTSCHGALIPEMGEGSRKVEVILPALSSCLTETESSFPLSLEWRVLWWGGGEVKEKTLVIEDLTSRGRVTFSIDTNGSGCFVASATPVLMPLGIVLEGYGGWGYTPDKRCVLSLDRGCLGAAVLNVARDGLSPDFVNLGRMQNAIDGEYRRGVEAIDGKRLEEGIRSLSFRYYHIRPLARPVLEVRIRKNGDEDTVAGSTWFTDDQRLPRSEAVIAGEYMVWSVPVASGETRMFWRLVQTANGTETEKMTLTRTDEGHGSYHIFRSY